MAIFQKNTRYPVICSYCIQHDAASRRGVLLSQNKWSEIQGKSNSLRLFKLRSQSPLSASSWAWLTVLLCGCGVTGSSLASCGFPLVYLKDGPKGQVLCLALEIMTEEQNGLPPPVADVISMRFSTVRDHFMMPLYEKHTNKPKPSHSGLLMLAFDQSVCWGGFSLVSPSVLVPVEAGVFPWCHAVPLWPRLQELCEAPAGWFSPWCTKVPFSLLILSSARTWQCLAVQTWSCAEAEPLSSWEGHQSHLTIFFEEQRYFVGTGRNGKEGRTVTWGDTAGVGKWREQPAARDAAAVPEPAEHRDQTSSGNHGHRLLTGKNRWCRSWGRNTESLLEGLCQGGGTKG